eukprot:scaffold21527_cov58-Phaeocystis_antarctica.AAC.1
MAATQRRCGRQRQRCQPELISGARAWGWCVTGASSHLLDTCKVAAVAWYRLNPKDEKSET